MCLIYFNKSNRKKYIYIHIPNTGGKIIKDEIERCLNNKVIKKFNDYEYNLNLKYIPFNKLNKYVKSFKNTKIYSYIKNPYYRIIEIFLKNFKNKKIKEFKDFCKNILSKYKFDLSFNKDHINFYPQYLFLCNKDYKLKNIDVKKIESKLDLKEYNILKYFDNHSLKIINFIYKNDFEIFGYEKYKNIDDYTLKINKNLLINNSIQNNILENQHENYLENHNNFQNKVLIKKNNELLIILLRGHIRNSFDNDNLYNLIKEIYKNNNNLEIYISTFNIVQNSISWRNLEENNTKVDRNFIKKYFKDIFHLIKNIIIIDDQKINLIGNLEGKVGFSKAPLLGWKNYWYSKYQGIKYIYGINKNKNINILNIRFDIMSNSFSFRINDIQNFITENSNNNNINNNIFLKRYPFPGLDNMYIGTIESQYKLSYNFYFKLDEIILQNRNILYQEYLVYIVNKNLFKEY